MTKRQKDVLALIKSTPLSDKKKQVAKYIVDNYIKVAFLTAAELARRSSVSEPTVIRLAVDLGYAGFPEMRSALQDKVQGKLTTLSRLKGSHRFKASKNPAVQSLVTDMKNLENTLHNINARTLNRVVNRIVQADKVIILGYKMSSCLAQFFQMALKKSIDNTVAVTTSPGQFQEELVFTTEKSVVIAISFPRYSTAVVRDFRMAKQKGVTTIAITDSELSPLVDHATDYLLARCDFVSYIDSFAAAMSLLCAIATAVSIKSETETLPRLEELEELWEKNEVFF
ncbi:MurR/RpiR family transcriptional regulator [Candidatus Bipolaricaulota bacterium]|jgi:DNA-binding MurR/RpiR family transcriptional regulator|nr:MurR/RpiR family transcriptional regulator [Candidatus Bipolaricaulota bacterium]